MLIFFRNNRILGWLRGYRCHRIGHVCHSSHRSLQGNLNTAEYYWE